MKEFEEFDVIIGCVGGGSNFVGLVYLFVRDVLKGEVEYEFIVVEFKVVFLMMRGVYKYDYGDFGGYMLKMKMYIFGYIYYVLLIYVGGLCYYGFVLIFSVLINYGIVKFVVYY